MKLNDDEAKNVIRLLRDGRVSVNGEPARDALLHALQAIEDRAALVVWMGDLQDDEEPVWLSARLHMRGEVE